MDSLESRGASVAVYKPPEEATCKSKPESQPPQNLTKNFEEVQKLELCTWPRKSFDFVLLSASVELQESEKLRSVLGQDSAHGGSVASRGFGLGPRVCS